MIRAVLLLIVAFIAAKIVKSLMVKLLSKTQLNPAPDGGIVSGGAGNAVDFIGRLM